MSPPYEEAPPTGDRRGSQQSLDEATKPQSTRPPQSGLTVAQYAEAKLFDPEKLRAWGVADDNFARRSAVRLPYWSASVRSPVKEEGRWRISLNGGNNFRWSKGVSAKRLYGWDRVDRSNPTVLLVEGESDCHALWSAGFRNVLGVPGVENVPDAIAQQLSWAETVYAIDEQDAGSPRLLSTLTARLGDQLRIVTVRPDAKDFSDLWVKLKADQPRFTEAVRGILETWREPSSEERKPTKKTATPPRYRTSGGDDRRWASTDSDNAARFVDLHRGQVRYIPEWDKWLAWTGKRWQLDLKNTLVHELAKDVAKSMLEEVPNAPNPETFAKAAAKALSRSSIANMVYLARGISGVPLNYEQLDADPWLLGVRNGVIDLRTGHLRDAKPEDLMTMQAPVAYEADAECPRWDQALEEWFPDPQVRAYVQRLTGSCLIGTQREHLFVIHFGHGANGKGTYVRAVEATLGPYATTPHLSLLVDDKNTQHDTVKAQLFRTRLAVATETERRVRLREAQIKNLTGGDRVLGRRLYEDPWEFDPSHTLWLVTNHLPEIAGRDVGIWRRIRVIPWMATFTGNADPDLDQALRKEKAGILRWLVEGCLEYQRQRLNEPAAIREATLEYQKAEDVITKWMTSSGLDFDPEKSIKATELTDLWRSWCDTHLGHIRRFNETADHLINNGCESQVRRWREGDKRRQETRWFGIGYTEVDAPGHPSPETFRVGDSLGKVSGEARPHASTSVTRDFRTTDSDSTIEESTFADALDLLDDYEAETDRIGGV